jgi:hypothetical protein
LRFRAPIRLFPMYHRSRIFFSLETTAQIAGVRPTAPGEACKTKILLRPLVTNDLRLSSDDSSALPEVLPPPHPVLLLPTRSFFFLPDFFF